MRKKWLQRTTGLLSLLLCVTAVPVSTLAAEQKQYTYFLEADGGLLEKMPGQRTKAIKSTNSKIHVAEVKTAVADLNSENLSYDAENGVVQIDGVEASEMRVYARTLYTKGKDSNISNLSMKTKTKLDGDPGSILKCQKITKKTAELQKDKAVKIKQDGNQTVITKASITLPESLELYAAGKGNSVELVKGKDFDYVGLDESEVEWIGNDRVIVENGKIRANFSNWNWNDSSQAEKSESYISLRSTKASGCEISKECKVTIKKPQINIVIAENNPATLQRAGKNNRTKLILTVNGEQLEGNDANVIWESSDPEIATVAGGTVMAAGKTGKVTISATVYGISVSKELTVNDLDVKLDLAENSAATIRNAGKNNSTKLKITVDGEELESNDKKITWESSDPEIATVKDGVVTAAGKTGTVTIRATVYGTTVKREIIVSSVDVKLDLAENSAATIRNAGKNNSTKLKITVDGEELESNDKKITWESSDPEIATVKDGVVTAAGKTGTVTIRATIYGTTVKREIIVSSVDVKLDLAENYSDEIQNAGKSNNTKLKIMVDGEELASDDSSITWESLNPEIATVKDGVVTATGKTGTVTIKATVYGEEVTYSIVVKSIEVKLELAENYSDEIQNAGKNTITHLKVFVSGEEVDANDSNITWESSNSTIATVKDGVVIANGASGTVEIMATIYGVTAKREINVSETYFEVRVKEGFPSTLTIAGTSSTSEVELVQDGSPLSAEELAKVEWTSGNESVLIVGKGDGKVTAVGTRGQCVIRATYYGKSYELLMRVEDVAMNLNQTALTLYTKYEPKSVLLEANINGEKVEAAQIEWSSSDPAIVSVDENGNVTQQGKTSQEPITITAINKANRSLTAQCQVTVSDAGFSISKKEISLAAGGKTATLKASGPAILDLSQTVWLIADDSVAKISSTRGEEITITPKKEGETKIIAAIVTADGQKTEECTVKVGNGAIKFSKAKINLYTLDPERDSVILECRKEATNEKVDLSEIAEWKIAPEGYISFNNKTGVVKALKAYDGEIQINAMNKSNKVMASCMVTVQKPELKFYNKPESNILYKNITDRSTRTLGCRIYYGDTEKRNIQLSDSKLKWKCDNKKALTVNNGMLTAKEAADNPVTVTATYSFEEGKEIQATYSVKVLAAYVKLNKTKITMKVGDKVQLSATSLPKDDKLTYKSSNSSIAKVSSNGTITAVKNSKTSVTITVKNESGQSDTCQVNVEK